MPFAFGLGGVDAANFGLFCVPPPLASPGRFRSPAGGIKQADIRAEGERKTGRGLYTRRDDGATEFLIAHTRVILDHAHDGSVQVTHELFSPTTRLEPNGACGIDTGAHRVWSLFSRAGVAPRDCPLPVGYPSNAWYLLLKLAQPFLEVPRRRRRRQVRAPSRRVGISSFAAMSCYRATQTRLRVRFR